MKVSARKPHATTDAKTGTASRMLTARPGHHAEALPAFDIATEAATRTTGGNGADLADPVRCRFESRFDHDFSRVRVYTDASAADAARAVDANAYALGNKIVFGAGQFSPDTTAGQRLLAHELTHVLQGRRGVQSCGIAAPDSAAEREAETAAADFTNGRKLASVRELAHGMMRSPRHAGEVSQRVTETIANAPSKFSAWNGTFAWTSRFGVRVNTSPDMLTIVMRLNASASPEVQARWKNAIESKWGGRFYLSATDATGAVACFSIAVDIQWVANSADAHYTINPQSAGATSDGRAGLGGTTSMTDWGTADTIDITHEFGHMLGNTEEYFSTNGVDFTRGGSRQGFRDPGGNVMNNPGGSPEPRHYDAVRREAASLMHLRDADCTVTGQCLPHSAPGDYPLPRGDTRYA